MSPPLSPSPDDEIGVELDDGDLPSVSQKTDDVNLGAYGFKEVK